MKGSLPKYTAQNLRKNKLDEQLIACIEDRVQVHAKRVVKASFFMNLFLRYLVDQHKGDIIDLEFPFHLLDQTFVRQLMLGNKGTTVSFDALDDFCEKTGVSTNDDEKRHLGDANIYSHACRQYIVNAKNHLNLNFDIFLNRLLYNISFRKYYDDNKYKKYAKNIVYDTRCKIHKWSHNINNQWWDELSLSDRERISQDISSTVHFIRKKVLRCKDSDKIDETWMNKNHMSILKLYIYILDQCQKRNQDTQELENWGSKPTNKHYIKLFNLLPIHTIKAHYITIDNNVFEGLYREVIGKLPRDWQTKKDEYWAHLFRIRKLEGKDNSFSHTLTTDGIAVDFHYKKPISLRTSWTKELDDKLQEIRNKYAKKEEQRQHEEAQGVQKKPRKNPKSKGQEDEEQEVLQDFLRGKRVLGLDPGRANIVYLAEEYTEYEDEEIDGKMIKAPKTKVRSYKLTRQHYYKKASISKCTQKTHRWMVENRAYAKAHEELSQSSLKTIYYHSFRYALDVRLRHGDVLWDEMLKPRWRKNRFVIYGGKKRTFQKFFQRVEKDSDLPIVIAYGSAKFSPTQKGEVAVPTSRAYQESKSRYPTILTPEFRSTIVKYNDHVRLWHMKEIIKDHQGRVRLRYKGDVRGLLWFSNQNNNKCVDRDLNGALNIMYFLKMGSGRADIFRRTTPFAKEQESDKKVIVKTESEEMIQKRIAKVRLYEEYQRTNGKEFQMRQKVRLYKEYQTTRPRQIQRKKRCIKTPYEIVNPHEEKSQDQSGC